MTSKRGSRRQHSPVRPGVGRETDLTRRSGVRDQRWSVLVVTNGERTERQYLEELRREPWVRADKVLVVCQRGDPEAVVKAANTRWDRDQFETCWAVCDVDQFDATSPSRLAKEFGVGLLWSNPCFEVWLILHLAACQTYFENARQAEAKLKKLVPSWDKRRLDFADFRDGVHSAVSRAQQLGECPTANPSTDVGRLIEHLAHLD